MSGTKFDFSWGHTRGLKDTILGIYPSLSKVQTIPLNECIYPPYEGVSELIESLQQLTNYLTNIQYKHIFVTAGCTQAVIASIYAMSKANTMIDQVATRKRYYPRYPSMIALTKKLHINLEQFYHDKHDIVLLDSPSNPMGSIDYPDNLKSDLVIWDAAYHSPTYGILPGMNMPNQIYCGSLSKLTGLNGLRLGWVATNDDTLGRHVYDYLKNSMCGISYPSQWIAQEILKDNTKLLEYFAKSNNLINNNREEILKLKHIFGSDQISNYGMFAFFEIDDKMEELFKKADVAFTDGKECGANIKSVRINLANSNEETQAMVEHLLKTDAIK